MVKWLDFKTKIGFSMDNAGPRERGVWKCHEGYLNVYSVFCKTVVSGKLIRNWYLPKTEVSVNSILNAKSVILFRLMNDVDDDEKAVQCKWAIVDVYGWIIKCRILCRMLISMIVKVGRGTTREVWVDAWVPVWPYFMTKITNFATLFKTKDLSYDPDSFRFAYKVSAIKHRCNKCRPLIVNLYTPDTLIKASGPKRHPR